MAIESAKDFIALVDSGKYLNGVNAKRGAGRTGLSAAEKEKVFAYIDNVFPPEERAAAKPAKKVVAGGKKLVRMAKVAKKKPGRKPREAAPDVEEAEAEVEEVEKTETAQEEKAEAAAPTPAKGLQGKKGLAKKMASTLAKKMASTLAISPSEVKTVADVLQLVDSTVQSSVSVINALRAAHEISNKGSIEAAIEKIKQTLEGAATMLHNNVVAPLSNTTNQPDPAVAARLEQVVSASANGLGYHTQMNPDPEAVANLPGT